MSDWNDTTAARLARAIADDHYNHISHPDGCGCAPCWDGVDLEFRVFAAITDMVLQHSDTVVEELMELQPWQQEMADRMLRNDDHPNAEHGMPGFVKQLVTLKNPFSGRTAMKELFARMDAMKEIGPNFRKLAHEYTYGEAGGQSVDCLHDRATCVCEDWIVGLLVALVEQIRRHLHIFLANEGLYGDSHLGDFIEDFFMGRGCDKSITNTVIEPAAWRVVCADGTQHYHRKDSLDYDRAEVEDVLEAFDEVNTCGPHRAEPLYAGPKVTA